MAAFPEDVQIAIDGAQALIKQAHGGNKARDAIVLAGGHVLLLKAIATFPDNEELCEEASEALSFIAMCPGELRRSALVAAGVGPLLSAAARTHHGNTKLFSGLTLKELGLRSD